MSVGTDARPIRAYPGMPRWVKLLLIAAMAVVALVVIVLSLGGHVSPVQHGP